jgi:uncharacterized membrane protein
VEEEYKGMSNKEIVIVSIVLAATLLIWSILLYWIVYGPPFP